MKVALGSDHAGFELKKKAAAWLRESGHEAIDLGPNSAEPCDYPRYAYAVARSVREGKAERGLLLCGTGIGMSMAANRVSGVRAALCSDREGARLSRAHNDANVLSIGQRLVPEERLLALVDLWLSTPFEGGRHVARIRKLDEP